MLVFLCRRSRTGGVLGVEEMAGDVRGRCAGEIGEGASDGGSG